MLGSEPVRVDGGTVGRVTSGGYGYSVGRSIAYAYLPASEARAGKARSRSGSSGVSSAPRSSAEPLFDPDNLRVRVLASAARPGIASAAASIEQASELHGRQEHLEALVALGRIGDEVDLELGDGDLHHAPHRLAHL